MGGDSNDIRKKIKRCCNLNKTVLNKANQIIGGSGICAKFR